jgi:hypothetical protein
MTNKYFVAVKVYQNWYEGSIVNLNIIIASSLYVVYAQISLKKSSK